MKTRASEREDNVHKKVCKLVLFVNNVRKSSSCAGEGTKLQKRNVLD